LLETAANVFAKNKQHQTAYNIACEMGHHEVGLLLLDYQDQMDYSKKPVNQPSYRYNERPDDENRSLAEESHQYVNATANPLPRPHHGSVHK
jgi:ankyrin repeat protein